MSIRKRINKVISCILTLAMVLSCMANMTPAFAADETLAVTVSRSAEHGDAGFSDYVTVSWNAITDAEYYEIYRKTADT